MDYEKEYKQLYKFICDLYPHMSEYCKEKVEGFFPELRENERVKRAIIHILYENYSDTSVIEGVEISEIIAWLEKQGEKEVSLSIEDDEIRKEIMDYLKDFIPHYDVNLATKAKKWISWLEKQGEQNRLGYPYVTGWRKNLKDNKPQIKHSVLMLTTHGVAEGEWLGEIWLQYRWSCIIKDEDVLYWLHLSDFETLEKQDSRIPAEEDSINKVKPKFKVGDWIVGEGYTCKVVDIRERFYKLYFRDGKTVNCDIPYVDEKYRLWVIDNAEDGDVLTYLLDDGKELIMIYEGLGKSFDGEVAAHALLDGDNYFSSSVGSVCCKFMENLIPATKEQRDLLFQKMAEAGYKWDAENKVLRKQCDQESADNAEPKFKIGDLIKRRGKNVTFRVDRIQGGYYYCDQQYGSFFPIEEQDEWELIERKKINLINILKYYPKETRLFSPLCGYIWLAEVDEENGIITCYKNPLECGCTRATLGLEETISFYSDGSTGLPDYSITDNCMLFFDMNLTSIDKMGPKFNIGDWIVEKDLDEFNGGEIVAIRDGKYILNNGHSVRMDEQNAWGLVKKDF